MTARPDVESTLVNVPLSWVAAVTACVHVKYHGQASWISRTQYWYRTRLCVYYGVAACIARDCVIATFCAKAPWFRSNQGPERPSADDATQSVRACADDVIRNT